MGNLFKDKIAIITGASSGIGLALARELSQLGTHLVIAARRFDVLEQVASELGKNGVAVLPVKTDVAIPADCERLIQKTIEKYGRIDILINNAGISMRARFSNVQIDVLKRLMDVNFWGALYCTKHALPYLLESRGSLIGISSIAGFKGLPGRAGYSSSKFAMQGLLETIRIEHLKDGLHVMVVAPGFTATEIRKNALLADGTSQLFSPRDENNIMSAEEVAKKIIRGIRFRRRNLIFTWKGKILVLFQRILPKIIDRLAYGEMAREPGSPI
ncbi:MAG: SDR family oxidoreductase [Bacteroidota bacterium]